MKKRRPLPLLLLLLLLTLAPCQPSWAQIPFVRGKAVDQRLTQLDILGDSVGLNFADRQPLVAARADVQVAFGSVRLLEWGGWLESAFATFLPYPGATRYHAYVRGGQYAEFTPLDRQLIRLYPGHVRVDAVGLRPADDYQLKIVPTDADDAELTAAATVTPLLHVAAYDRTGFAHFNYHDGVGAYRDDGTLKAGAVVVYVTAQTARTVTATLGSGGTFTGLQAILQAYEKGGALPPLAVRIVGCLAAADMDALGSSAEGLQVKGRSNQQPLSITIEGIGHDATIKDMGILVRRCHSVELRNLGLLNSMDDGLSFDTDNRHCWAHHLDFFYGRDKGGDQAKGDGSLDVKADSQFMTFSYCHFWDSGKTSLCGMKSETGPNYITYHHNWFDHSDSRHPRVRTMSVHIYNNYYDGIAKYGAGATTGSSVFMDRNYFRHTPRPMLISLQGTDTRMGTDLEDAPTFSGEDGGIIKSYGNVFAEQGSNFSYATYQQNPLQFDAYEASSPLDPVPASVTTRSGGHAYNNFDVDPALMYAYQADDADSVPALVTGWLGAGRMGHGDLQWQFNNATDDASSALCAPLAAAVRGYRSALVGIVGEEASEPADTTVTPPQPVDGVILCTFDKNGQPSSSFFTVTGNGSASKGTATVDGQVLTTCLKMESTTSIRFTLAVSMTMTLYFGDTETASIRINGQKIQGTASTYTQTLPPGDYELTKDKSVNLFAIKLEPMAAE